MTDGSRRSDCTWDRTLAAQNTTVSELVPGGEFDLASEIVTRTRSLSYVPPYRHQKIADAPAAPRTQNIPTSGDPTMYASRPPRIDPATNTAMMGTTAAEDVTPLRLSPRYPTHTLPNPGGPPPEAVVSVGRATSSKPTSPRTARAVDSASGRAPAGTRTSCRNGNPKSGPSSSAGAVRRRFKGIRAAIESFEGAPTLLIAELLLCMDP